MRDPTGQFILGPEYAPPNKNRFVVEVPDKFATARWSRDADVATIARCILGTLKYEPHAADTTVLRRALEDVIEHTARGGTAQTQQEALSMKRTQGQSGDTTTTDEQKTVDKSEMPSSLADVEAEMTVEQWLAIRKEAALRIDPETAEVEWIYADIGDLAVYTTYRRKAFAWGGHTLPVHPKATFGFALTTCPKWSATPCGTGTAQSWRFRQGSRRYPDRQPATWRENDCRYNKG